ncbi:hypothetical protein LOD99_13885 [Oopsacas minuta]|uniref:Uncharacterized protein n=1 Tax=Oopsacas minuta TaxID=111878 RepID=A0AAV7KG81_9METZ|nr:hypothetical protein LOD99_13885 [Oopsacas minuta]
MAERDTLTEIRSHANMAETHRVLHRWENSCRHSLEHIRLSRQLNDKFEECKALHSLGAVYHSRGKTESLSLRETVPGCYPPLVTDPLTESTIHYQDSINISREIQNNQLLARGLVDLGSVYYMLGRCVEGVMCLQERLDIAIQECDILAQQQTHGNLGNTYTLSGDMERALDHYKHTLLLSIELQDWTLEARCSYSMGLCYYMIKQYDLSVDSLLKYLRTSTRLKDKAGCLRACWSLSQSYSSLSKHREALRYAKIHLSIATELNHLTAVEVAQHNVSAIQRHNLRHKDIDPEREAMLVLEDCITPVSPGDIKDILIDMNRKVIEETPDRLDHLLVERLMYSQNRLEDQRCPMPPSKPLRGTLHTSKSVDDLVMLIADTQTDRIEEQRAPLIHKKKLKHVSFDLVLDDVTGIVSFLDRCHDHTIEDQRSTLPLAPKNRYQKPEETEDFYNLIMQAQSHRIDDQRTSAQVPLL